MKIEGKDGSDTFVLLVLIGRWVLYINAVPTTGTSFFCLLGCYYKTVQHCGNHSADVLSGPPFPTLKRRLLGDNSSWLDTTTKCILCSSV